MGFRVYSYVYLYIVMLNRMKYDDSVYLDFLFGFYHVISTIARFTREFALVSQGFAIVEYTIDSSPTNFPRLTKYLFINPGTTYPAL
ncbi:hypothetical protein Hanom_Chr04g00332961 [Helianthus anomalus]